MWKLCEGAVKLYLTPMIISHVLIPILLKEGLNDDESQAWVDKNCVVVGALKEDPFKIDEKLRELIALPAVPSGKEFIDEVPQPADAHRQLFGNISLKDNDFLQRKIAGHRKKR